MSLEGQSLSLVKGHGDQRFPTTIKMSVLENCQENLGDDRMTNLLSVTGKIMEQVLMETTSIHTTTGMLFRMAILNFARANCVQSPNALYNYMTGSLGEVRAAGVVLLVSSKTFETVS